MTPAQPQPADYERGSSTAEFAVILPALVFVLGLVLGAAATGIVQLRLEESARLGARAAARGDTAQAVQAIVQDLQPGASSSISVEGAYTRVTVSATAPGIIGRMTGWELTADAQALTEHVSEGRSTEASGQGLEGQGDQP